ncbi:hypothetical protein [Caulobacter sp. NIBR1757]|uniref:hypothetical protein n=1 Tax=Caulobacter sp. NIBR1757 TaxID=3016000 RepID=UPI0022F0E801|nr:hypothetical protein [Caulobacter sp. NIBR1757]WGM38204.1 hypothetical protein AMEJIAPC_01106 [Caulobacter sp. NIBR1757]
MNTVLIKRRLGWYGLAWLGAFMLALLVALAGVFLFGADVIDMADMLIPVGLGILSLALVGVVGRDLFLGETIGTKVAVVLLAVLLFLPLLWSPVSAMVAAAWIADRSIEYSAAYAQFRITISQLLYPMIEAVSSGAAFELAWQAFQFVASAVGFLSSLFQVIAFLRRLFAARSVDAFVEEMTAPPEDSGLAPPT